MIERELVIGTQDMPDLGVLVCAGVYVCSKVPGPCIPRTSLLMPILAFGRCYVVSCREE